MFSSMRTISELIKAAGGPAKIADSVPEAITVDAVYKWQRIGIPDRYWPVVMRLANASADEMLAANVTARSPSESAA